MRFSYLNGSVNYFPNRLADGLPEPQDQMKKPGPYVQGEITRQSIEKTNDFQQAGKLFCSFSPVEQEHLFGNLAVELAQCSSETVEQLLQYFGKADPRYEEGVRKAIEKEKQKKGR